MTVQAFKTMKEYREWAFNELKLYEKETLKGEDNLLTRDRINKAIENFRYALLYLTDEKEGMEFKKLLDKYPLTGIVAGDDTWEDLGNGIYRSFRYKSVYKDQNGKMVDEERFRIINTVAGERGVTVQHPFIQALAHLYLPIEEPYYPSPQKITMFIQAFNTDGSAWTNNCDEENPVYFAALYLRKFEFGCLMDVLRFYKDFKEISPEEYALETKDFFDDSEEEEDQNE